MIDQRSEPDPELPAGELLLQALHGGGLAAHAEEGAVVIGALLDHGAGGEDLAALVLADQGR